jgi:hypothetical protein
MKFTSSTAASRSIAVVKFADVSAARFSAAPFSTGFIGCAPPERGMALAIVLGAGGSTSEAVSRPPASPLSTSMRYRGCAGSIDRPG